MWCSGQAGSSNLSEDISLNSLLLFGTACTQVVLAGPPLYTAFILKPLPVNLQSLGFIQQIGYFCNNGEDTTKSGEWSQQTPPLTFGPSGVYLSAGEQQQVLPYRPEC